MVSINVLDARNNLSRLVTAAGEGEDVVISKRGRPVVRLVRIEPEVLSHTGAQAAEWLTRNPPPAYTSRSPHELEKQIATERDAWE